MLSKTILPEILATVVCEKYTLEWLTGQILRIHIHENAFLEMDDLREMQEHKIDLTKRQIHSQLFIAPQMGNISKEGREYAATGDVSVNAVAKAIVTPNMGMRILVNFFVTMNKPALPHRSFSNEPEALNWLQEMLIKNKVKNQ